MKLVVKRKVHTRRETRDGKRVSVTYGPGETFDGTERELKAFVGRLARATALVDEPESEGEPKELADYTVTQLREIAEAEEVDHSGLKKLDLIAAIEAKRAESDGAE